MPKRAHVPKSDSPLRQNTDTKAEHFHYAHLHVRPKYEDVYPAWLNAVAWPVFSLIPIGLFFVIAGYTLLGLAALGVSFVCISGFGEYAARIRRREPRGWVIGRGR